MNLEKKNFRDKYSAYYIKSYVVQDKIDTHIWARWYCLTPFHPLSKQNVHLKGKVEKGKRKQVKRRGKVIKISSNKTYIKELKKVASSTAS